MYLDNKENDMNINIICLGKLKEKYLLDGVNEYLKRIGKYATIKIIELPDEVIPENASQKEIENIQKIEAEKIQKQIKNQDYCIALDLTGKEFTSEEFAGKIQEITLKGFSTINFIIGGTTGLSRELVTNCHLVFSFSKLTFPHQLIRLFLTEQIFRAFKIIHHEKYHW